MKYAMYNIKEKEKNLFLRWAMSLNLTKEDSFSNGGLLFRGDFGLNDINEFNLYTWNRLEGKEEEIWCKSPKRLMILTKDLNDTEGWDIREESGGRTQLYEKIIPVDEDIQYSGLGFYRKLNRWVYGIYKESNGSYPQFSDLGDFKEMGKFYESAPLVRINCKIEIGGSRVENKILINSMNQHKEFLIEQIKLYHANIILCCGFQKGCNVILNFIKEHIFEDLKPVPNTDDWIYFSNKYNLIAINSYHPTTRHKKDEFLYDELVKNFAKAVANYHIKFKPLI